jgi:hypothetical protein
MSSRDHAGCSTGVRGSSTAEHNTWILLIGGALLQHGHEVQADPRGPGGMFSLSDPGRHPGRGPRRRLRRGPDGARRGARAAADVRRLLGAPHAHRWAGRRRRRRLDDDTVREVRETCRAFADRFRVDRGYAFPGEALVTVAR